jgi:hypothetical protein
MLEALLFILGYEIAPTSLAGPGLDMSVLLLSIIFNLVMIIVAIRNWRKGLIEKLYIIAILFSFTVLSFLMILPGDVFRKYFH